MSQWTGVSVAAGRKAARSGAASRRNTLRSTSSVRHVSRRPVRASARRQAPAAPRRLHHRACRTAGQIGPVAFWIAVGTVVIMAGWSVTAATYFAFRDDVLRRPDRAPGRTAIRL